MKALALSPHLDDAAFSAGGTLARLAREGWEVVVLTAFTRSVPNPTGFALACQLDKGLRPEVDYMALRRAEDAQACAALGAQPAWLDFAEAPHRGYDSAAALFGPVRDDDGVAAPLAAALAPHVAEAALVLAPRAVGGHVDHVLLLRALWMLPDLPECWHWEDWPYTARPHSHPARPFAARFAALPERAADGDAPARRAACLAYASQLGFQFGGVAELDAALGAAGGRERFRVSAPAAAPASPASPRSRAPARG